MVRMTDADPPRPAVLGKPAGHDVAAGVDPVVAAAGAIDQPGGFLDRPALDVARRIQAPISSMVARVERAVGGDGKVIAGSQNVAEIGAGVCLHERAVGQSADLAVGAVGAEPGVRVVEPLDHLVEDGLGDEGRLDADADCRPHHGFDATKLAGRRRAHPTPAWSSADWSDCVYASLVYVAPDTRSIFPLCAWSASWRRIGLAYCEIWPDRRPLGSSRATTSVALPLATITSTWTSP